MHYPVLVNPGKAFVGSFTGMHMKKKGGATGPRAPKSGKPSAATRKSAPPRARSSLARRTPATTGARSTIRELKAQLAEAQARIEALQASAATDFLLDILNRRGFEREFRRSIAYIKRYHAHGALIVLDVDRLEPINDVFGHVAGDEVLKATARTISEQVRASDVVGRLGGDEFAVLLWNLSETDARAKAAALEQAIDNLTFVFRDSAVRTGASAGVAVLGPHAEASRALDEADRAMYVRKAQRRHEAND
jgi:diguanylate cyclase (GGDEF)-like protein